MSLITNLLSTEPQNLDKGVVFLLSFGSSFLTGLLKIKLAISEIEPLIKVIIEAFFIGLISLFLSPILFVYANRYSLITDLLESSYVRDIDLIYFIAMAIGYFGFKIMVWMEMLINKRLNKNE